MPARPAPARPAAPGRPRASDPRISRDLLVVPARSAGLARVRFRSPCDSHDLLGTLGSSQASDAAAGRGGAKMTVVSVLGDTAVVVLGTLTVACFIGIVIASVLVTGAVHTEERHRTLTGPPPGPC